MVPSAEPEKLIGVFLATAGGRPQSWHSFSPASGGASFCLALSFERVSTIWLPISRAHCQELARSIDPAVFRRCAGKGQKIIGAAAVKKSSHVPAMK